MFSVCDSLQHVWSKNILNYVIDDIVTIENKNTEEHHQAIASMELWQQTNGRFQIDILLDALRDIRRKDIVNDLLDYFSTQNQL